VLPIEQSDGWTGPVSFGEYHLPGWRLTCRPADGIVNTATVFTLPVSDGFCLRQRQTGDVMRLPGGTKSLKKLFIDRKIPASQRTEIPVLADEAGVLGVPGIGPNLDRIAEQLPAVQFVFDEVEK
jgi:tRNA(Ile)-lysidine synthase